MDAVCVRLAPMLKAAFAISIESTPLEKDYRVSVQEQVNGLKNKGKKKKKTSAPSFRSFP